MAQSHESQPKDEAQSLLHSSHRRPHRRWIHLRRKRLPIVRLGGERPPRAAAHWRSIRFRKWLMKIRCDCLVKKLKQLFGKGTGSGGDGGGGFDAFLKRILMEISLAVPVLGASLAF
ncbi:hypothetical protein SDJN03_13032, partial [Cucurbita argyrosperma subsp. sororia]